MNALVTKFAEYGLDLYPAGIWKYVDGKKVGVDVMRKDGSSWGVFTEDNMAKYRVDNGFYVLDYDDLTEGKRILPGDIVEKSMKTLRYYTSNKMKMHCVFKRSGDFPYNRYIWAEGAVDSLPKGIIFTGHPSGAFDLIEAEVLEISDEDIARINMAIAAAKGDELDADGNYHWGVEHGSMDHVITFKGREVGTLGSLPFEGTRCDCPFGVSHSDGKGGEGYAFVTESGGVGCNSCEKILYPPEFEKALSDVKTELVDTEDGGQTTREVEPPKVWRDFENKRYAIYHRGRTRYTNKEFFSDQFKHITGYEGKIPFASFEDRETVFDPTHCEKFYEDERGNKYFNTFVPTKAMEQYNYARSHGMVGKMPHYIGLVLENVFEEHEVRDLWLHNLAYHLSRFEVAKSVNIVIGKAGGEGKGLLFNELMEMIYGDYFHLTNKDVFLEKHNGHLEGCLALFVDEIYTESKLQGEKILMTFKKYTSNKEIEVRGMATTAKKVKNFMRVNVATNKGTPTAIDSNTDRRFIINETHGGNINKMEWFPEDIEGEFRKEIPALMKYLAGIELSPRRYNEIIETAVKEDIYFDTLTLREKVALCIKEEDWDKLEDYATEEFAFEKMMNHLKEHGRVAVNDVTTAFGLEGSNRMIIKSLKALDLEVKTAQIGGKVIRAVLFAKCN